MKVRCPSCNLVSDQTDAGPGGKVDCPNCLAVILIPKRNSVPAFAIPVEDPPAPRPTYPQRSRAMPWIVGFVAGVVLLGATLLLYVLISGRETEPVGDSSALAENGQQNDAFQPPDPRSSDSAPSPPGDDPADDVPLPEPIRLWSMDEGKGSTTTDASGAHVAQLINTRWVPGRFGKALQFNGSSSYVDLGDSPDLDFAAGEPFTFSIYFNSPSGRGPLVSFRPRDQFTSGAVIDLFFNRIGDLEANVREDAKRGLAWQAKSKATRNEWSHAALTRDSQGGVALYLNG